MTLIFAAPGQLHDTLATAVSDCCQIDADAARLACCQHSQLPESVLPQLGELRHIGRLEAQLTIGGCPACTEGACKRNVAHVHTRQHPNVNQDWVDALLLPRMCW